MWLRRCVSVVFGVGVVEADRIGAVLTKSGGYVFV